MPKRSPQKSLSPREERLHRPQTSRPRADLGRRLLHPPGLADHRRDKSSRRRNRRAHRPHPRPHRSGIDCFYACHGATGGRSPELELAGSIRLRAALGRCHYTVRTQITSRHEEQKFSIWCYERNAPLGCNPVQDDWRQIPARSFRWFRRGRAGSNSRRC